MTINIKENSPFPDAKSKFAIFMICKPFSEFKRVYLFRKKAHFFNDALFDGSRKFFKIIASFVGIADLYSISIKIRVF